MTLTAKNLKEAVLGWIMEQKPDAHCPKATYGHPPMWIIAKDAGGAGLAVRPARTMTRMPGGYEEVDGIAFQMIKDGDWIGQGMSTTWDDFTDCVPDLIGENGTFLIPELEAARQPENKTSDTPHPLSPEAQSQNVLSAFTGTLPAGIVLTQSQVSVSNSFSIRISDQIQVKCACDMNILGQTWASLPKSDAQPELRSVNLFADLATDQYDHEEVTMHIPDWGTACGERLVELDALTRRLAYNVESPETVFPIDEEAFTRTKSPIGEALKTIYARKAKAITWLLDKVNGERAALDLDRIRIMAGSDVYDGHGRLLAYRMRLRPEEVYDFLQTHGEEQFIRAMTEGHIHGNGEAALQEEFFSEKRARDFCDRIQDEARPSKRFWPYVSWDREAFEAVIRPHVPEGAFAGTPGPIDGRNPGLVLLEARMGLAPRAPEQLPEIS